MMESSSQNRLDRDDIPVRTRPDHDVARPTHPSVAVVGAGAFGGWIALFLRRRGVQVTLIDAWGPGNARASSGGETRILRLSHPRPEYARLAHRALGWWREFEELWNRRLFVRTGLLWMATTFGEVEHHVVRSLEAERVEHDRLDRSQLSRQFPQIRTDDLDGAIVEPGAGYLLAREACGAVWDAFVRGGGTYRMGWAQPGPIKAGRMDGLILSDGSRLWTDTIVFAAGPWLPGLFPDVLANRLRVTRQEVFVFGTPPGEDRFGPGRLPIWALRGDRFWYGIPGAGTVGGFKIADDSRGPEFDPTRSDRTASAAGLQAARHMLSDRFPALAGSPLLEARVCQYTEASGGTFLADRHPEASNVWLVGGGSGHGFKHGPAVGEAASALILGDREPGDDPAFAMLSDGPGQSHVDEWFGAPSPSPIDPGG